MSIKISLAVSLVSKYEVVINTVKNVVPFLYHNEADTICQPFKALAALLAKYQIFFNVKTIPMKA